MMDRTYEALRAAAWANPEAFWARRGRRISGEHFFSWRRSSAVLILVMGYFATITTLGYLVSPTALQINWGFRRMEVVPASAIDSVTIEPIHPARDFGGWGARWSGEDRAYILKGKTAVKIATPCGNIFLGSNSPEDLLKLVRRMNIAHA